MATNGKAALRDVAPDLHDSALFIEEVEIEREAHAKGVDARAMGDQQAGASLLAIEMGETKEPNPRASGDRHLQIEHDNDRKTAQTSSSALNHADPRLAARHPSPAKGLTSHLFVHRAKKDEVSRPVLAVASLC